jgi:hypothetical protein
MPIGKLLTTETVVNPLAGTLLAADLTAAISNPNPPGKLLEAATAPLPITAAATSSENEAGEVGETEGGKSSAESRRRGERVAEEWRGGGIMTGERELPAEGEELSTTGGGEVGKEKIGWSGGPDRERSGGAVKNPTLRTFGSLAVLGARRESILLQREIGKLGIH